ncbi:MAG: encapsulin, partial [Chloroflexi bacterium]|nr:encapsulin [Chloroflexota bacterium]
MDMQFIQNMIANGSMTVAQRLLASGMNVNCLRTNATLQKDEWLVLDRAIIDVAQNRLRVYRDVIERGLVLALTNGLGKTVLESENVGDMRRAQVSMDGVTVGENDAVNYETVGIPLPFIHKDYTISIRKLNASRNEGEALDTTQARLSTRKIAEEQELMLLNGFGITTATYTIYGYTNFPQRNTVTLVKDWDDVTITGANIVADVLAMKQALIDAKFFGPYALYIPTAYETPLDEEALDRALDQLAAEGVEALAVCFLFSYLNPDHEMRVSEKIEKRFPGMYTSISSQVIPQIKEFDRLSTTVVNSYVGPVFGKYLANLKERLSSYQEAKDVLVMQSNGGVAPIEDSSRMAVRAILSGPAGGVNGAAAYGRLLDQPNIIAFDMGGTSTDISLIQNGVPHLTTEKFEAGWKIAVPMIDIHTMGAGGGSIASVGPGGILHVGPESAGADPGPACYGKGGTLPTVTDASLLLGYLDSNNFLGGQAKLDRQLSERALEEHVAEPLGLSTAEAAHGVSRVVSAAIAEGIRLMSVHRGV